MLAAERYQHILRLVNEWGSVRVADLSQLCRVTDETIRRDLDRLESEGHLLRSYGGAVRAQAQSTETSHELREAVHAGEKQSIAAAAARLLEPNDRIVLDASTTAIQLAVQLPDIPLTVLTNSLRISLLLSERKNITVIGTGGTLVPKSLSYVGPLAEQFLEEYHVNKAFLSCKGVHLERGISESNELQARVKRKMVAMADQVFVLADGSKFDVQAFTMISGWDGIHSVITDSRAPAGHVQSLQRRAIEVILAG